LVVGPQVCHHGKVRLEGGAGGVREGEVESVHINAIAREFAYDVALSTFDPLFDFQHVRGKNNEWADALSRIAMPGHEGAVPGPPTRSSAGNGTEENGIILENGEEP
jgi:hypothetical protein